MGQPDGIRLILLQHEKLVIREVISNHGARAVYEACLSWFRGEPKPLTELGLDPLGRSPLLAPVDVHACALILGVAQRCMAADVDLLNQYRDEYAAGKQSALALAVETCRGMHWDWPEWVQVDVRKCVEASAATIKKHDLHAMLFGKAPPLKQQQAIQNEGLLQCWELLSEMKSNGQLWAPDGGEAILTSVLADFVGWFTNDSNGVSEKTLEGRLNRARQRRKKIPKFTAIGFEIPMMFYLSDRGYWHAKRD